MEGMSTGVYEWKVNPSCNMCGSADRKFLGDRLDRSQGYFPLFKRGTRIKVWCCRVCGLIYADPLPIPSSIDMHYKIPAESYWKEEYFAEDPSYFKQELNTLRSLMRMENGMQALDIGAGIGKAMKAMKHAGFSVTGLEPSETFRRKAIENMGISPDSLKAGSAETTEFPDDSFDFVTFGAVLEHLYDPARALRNAVKWLKPGGIIHAEVPNSNYLVSKIFNTYYRFWCSGLVTHLSPMHAPFHIHEFTLDSFVRNGKQTGYTVKHHEYYPGTINFLPRFLHGYLHKKMEGTNKGMQLCVWLSKP